MIFRALVIICHLDIPESFEDLDILDMLTNLVLEILFSLRFFIRVTEVSIYWVTATENAFTHHVDESY